jgi:hypothetical protein
MALFFPREFETIVSGSDGYVQITQRRNGKDVTIFLTKHQFDEIYNRSRTIYKELDGEE